jgi:hypothetical protein
MMEEGGHSNLLTLPPDLHNSTQGENGVENSVDCRPKATFFDEMSAPVTTVPWTPLTINRSFIHFYLCV